MKAFMGDKTRAKAKRKVYDKGSEFRVHRFKLMLGGWKALKARSG
jgi:hypothetical protein